MDRLEEIKIQKLLLEETKLRRRIKKREEKAGKHGAEVRDNKVSDIFLVDVDSTWEGGGDMFIMEFLWESEKG